MASRKYGFPLLFKECRSILRHSLIRHFFIIPFFFRKSLTQELQILMNCHSYIHSIHGSFEPKLFGFGNTYDVYVIRHLRRIVQFATFLPYQLKNIDLTTSQFPEIY